MKGTLDPKLLNQFILEIAADPARRQKALQEIGGHLARISFAEFVQRAWPTVEPSTPLDWNWHHQLICDTLQAMFCAWRDARSEQGKRHRFSKGLPKNAVFNLPPGSLKPVSVKSKIFEQKSGIKTIAEVSVGDYVLTHEGRFREVKAIARQGVLPVLKIITSQGKVIRAAHDHPFLTTRGWIEAQHLTTNDILAETHSKEAFGSQTVSDEEARLLGYLIGDGSLGGSPGFTNQCPETIEDFKICVNSIGLETVTRTRAPSLTKTGWLNSFVGIVSPERTICVHCNKNPPQVGRTCRPCLNERNKIKKETGKYPEYNKFGLVRQWLDKHDLFGRNSYTKRVPLAIMQGNESVVAEYLAAYWACDGCIHDRRDLPRAGRDNQVTNTVRIDAYTVSEELARDHLLLLQRLGLRFKLRKKTQKLTRQMATGERVGQNYISWQVVASDQDTCAKFMEIVGSRIKHDKRTNGEGLKRISFDNVRYADPIVSIEPDGEDDCMCLQVEEDSSFVCDGVAVHNSRIIAVCYQAWCWIHEPGMKFICLSVNEDAMLRDARMSRDLIRSEWYQSTFKPKWQLKKDQEAVGNYGNTHGGERLSKASGSEIVGLRGDVLLVDDPNNPKESENKAERDHVNNLWTTNQANRVNNPLYSMRIGVQQRTHALDWTGYVLGNQGLWSPENEYGWLHIVLPVEFEKSRAFIMPECLAKYCTWPGAVTRDPRTEEGQSLHEARFTKEYLASEKHRWKNTGNYVGQMQQRPAAMEGQKVNRRWWGWFRLADGVRDDIVTGHFPRPPMCHEGEAQVIHQKHFHPDQWDFDWITISVDPAAKKTEKGSLYGLLCIAGKGGRRYVLDDRSQRGAFHEILEVIGDMVKTWRPDTILIEPKAAGPDLMDTLKEQMFAGDLPMVAIEEAEPGNSDKEMRFEACVPYIKNGAVYLTDGAEWLEEFVNELSAFPNGETDDRVDALSQCLNFKRAADDDLPDW